MGWLEIQIIEYLQKGTRLFLEIKKFLTCVSDGEVIVL